MPSLKKIDDLVYHPYMVGCLVFKKWLLKIEKKVPEHQHEKGGRTGLRIGYDITAGVYN